MTNTVSATSGAPVPAVLLHSSASTANQWRDLEAVLAPERVVATPEQRGCGGAAPWRGERIFSLAEEAGPIIELIESAGGSSHLVGHSFGGGVALNIARRRPDLLTSLTLIEPTAFHLLQHGTDEDRAAYREVRSVADGIARSILTGHYRGGMARFVDYWNGHGSWDRMSPGRQDVLAERVAKLPLDFHALLHEEARPDDFRSMTVPTLLIRGTQSPRPAVRVAEMLHRTLPSRTMVKVAGAGHMVPLTHAPEVNPLIRDFIARHDPTARVAA